MFLPEARAFHKGGATTAPRRLRSRSAYRESQILYYRKHASRLSQVLLRLYLRLAFPAEGLKRTPPGAGKPGGGDRSGGRPAKGERR